MVNQKSSPPPVEEPAATLFQFPIGIQQTADDRAKSHDSQAERHSSAFEEPMRRTRNGHIEDDSHPDAHENT